MIVLHNLQMALPALLQYTLTILVDRLSLSIPSLCVQVCDIRRQNTATYVDYKISFILSLANLNVDYKVPLF